MIKVILTLSATTPSILFIGLLIKYSIQQNVPSSLPITQSHHPKTFVMDQFFEDHFEKLIAVELKGKRQTIDAYVNAKANGNYQILTLDGKLVLEVRKNFSGWLVTKEGNAVKDPRQFLTPLILMLERRFYN